MRSVENPGKAAYHLLAMIAVALSGVRVDFALAQEHAGASAYRPAGNATNSGEPLTRQGAVGQGAVRSTALPPALPNSGNPTQTGPLFDLASHSVSSATPQQFPSEDGLLPEERVNIAVYAKCNRSVVHISTTSVGLDSFMQIKLSEAGGSGAVIDRSGLVLTNQHVVDGAREVNVSLQNGLWYSARVIGEDAVTDIAVLKIDAPEEALHPIEWGESSDLRVGQRIYAIGNPFGLQRTMSAGMISALDRQIPARQGRKMRYLIQIDASINQGNSGGPLINTRGQLIGMNTAIMSSDGDSAGVGFAIPASTLARVVPQLIQNGKVVRASIGIRRVYETEDGLRVVDTIRGGPAEQAGLRGFRLVTKNYQQGGYHYPITVLDTSQADLIIAADGQIVTSGTDLLDLVQSKRPGDSVVLTIVRNGQQQQLSVTLTASDD